MSLLPVRFFGHFAFRKDLISSSAANSENLVRIVGVRADILQTTTG